jgi:dihydroxyacetone kinase-like predicted kinase
MQNNLYRIEFILETRPESLQSLKKSLSDLGKDLLIMSIEGESGNNTAFLKIQIATTQPEAVFDQCSFFGRLNNIKVDESRKGDGKDE